MKFIQFQFGVILMGLAGCTTLSHEPLVAEPGAHEVLDQLKAELGVLATMPSSPMSVSVCSGSDTPVQVTMVPVSATLSLKVVAANSLSGSLGAKFPIGGVVTVSIGGSATNKNVRSQTVNYEFGIQHEPTLRELRAALSSLLKEVEEDSKRVAIVRRHDPAIAADIAEKIEEKQKKIAVISKVLLETKIKDNVNFAQPPRIRAPNQGQSDLGSDAEPILANYPLAAALWRAREELLQVNHNLKPCLKPGPLKMDVSFQVVREQQLKGGISFWIIEAGAQAGRSDEATHTLSVVFDLSQSTPLLTTADSQAPATPELIRQQRGSTAKQQYSNAAPPRFDALPAPVNSSAEPAEIDKAVPGQTIQLPYGSVQRLAIWLRKGWTPKHKPIPVCWENPTLGDAENRRMVQDAVAASWESVSPVRFTGWGPCKDNSDGIRILISDVGPDKGPHVKALGRYLNAYPNGMELNFQFERWGRDCQSNRVFCLKAIAVHEFGHALALAHEQNREDAPPECRKDRMQGQTGDWNVTDYDASSIMNYCNNDWHNNGLLSKRDIDTVQIVYGKP